MRNKLVDEKTVQAVEQMLTHTTVDTRAAVAAAALPGRIRAFSPHFAALRPDEQSRLARLVDTQMTGKGSVTSATGISAGLALNWCEARGHDYQVTRRGETYEVERLT